MIINVCTSDYANFSHDNAKALRAAGAECEDYKLSSHEFGYGSQSKLTTIAELGSILSKADIIQIMHSDITMLPIALRTKKEVVVWHTGTVYRQNSKRINQQFSGLKTFVALPEFYKLSPGSTYIVGAVENLKPSYKKTSIIGHYPSSAKVKGTQKICVFTDMDLNGYKFICDGNLLPYKSHLDRIRNCDIYIEMFNLRQSGVEYGSFGISALEAAMLGKVVVTNNLNKDVYERSYGDCALQITNTPEDFARTIKRLTTQDITELQKQTRRWVVKNHGYKPTGARILRELQG